MPLQLNSASSAGRHTITMHSRSLVAFATLLSEIYACHWAQPEAQGSQGDPQILA